MIRDVLGYAGFAVFGWWLWTGPVHDIRHVPQDEALRFNAQNMARCMESREFASSLTAPTRAHPQRACALQTVSTRARAAGSRQICRATERFSVFRLADCWHWQSARL